MEPIEPPWQAIKEWISDDEPDLDWFNRPRNPSNPDPVGLDQRPAWKPEKNHLDDGHILVLESTWPNRGKTATNNSWHSGPGIYAHSK